MGICERLRGRNECKLSNVQVTMRINQYLPALDDASLARVPSWPAVANRLAAHENIHAALDTQYATTLATELGSLSGACDTIIATGHSHAQAKSRALDAANNVLDATSAHGIH